MPSCYHELIDARLFRLVEASVQKIDENPALLRKLSDNVDRWTDPRQQKLWRQRLDTPWAVLRARLLAKTEKGAALRQDAPLGGILTPSERLHIMREFAYDPRAA
jgi:hypothetical protein